MAPAHVFYDTLQPPEVHLTKPNGAGTRILQHFATPPEIFLCKPNGASTRILRHFATSRKSFIQAKWRRHAYFSRLCDLQQLIYPNHFVSPKRAGSRILRHFLSPQGRRHTYFTTLCHSQKSIYPTQMAPAHIFYDTLRPPESH